VIPSAGNLLDDGVDVCVFESEGLEVTAQAGPAADTKRRHTKTLVISVAPRRSRYGCDRRA